MYSHLLCRNRDDILQYEAAQIAYDEENVTRLLTNEGKLYRSTNSKHLVMVFTGKPNQTK